jgi:hypothetical protein
MPILSRRLNSMLRPFHPRAAAPCCAQPAGAARPLSDRLSRSDLRCDLPRWYLGSGDDFMSGSGSCDAAIVGPYVEAGACLRRHLARAGGRRGSRLRRFSVGSQLVSSFASYRACDVVAALIERNRAKFVDSVLTFQLVDLVDDPLPPGDFALSSSICRTTRSRACCQSWPTIPI